MVDGLVGQTGVLTPRGILPIERLAEGRHTVLTGERRWAQAHVVSVTEQETIEMHLSRSGALKVLRATPGYRWPLRWSLFGHRATRATSELIAGDRFHFSFPCRVPCLSPNSEAVARGFVFGDGSIAGKRSVANFCGEKDVALLRFFSERRSPRTYEKVKRITGLPLEWKSELPPLDSPADVLYGWLAGYFAADGDVDRTGRPTLASAKRQNLEFVRELGNTIGVGTFGIRMRMRKGFGRTETPLYLLGLMRGDLCGSFFAISEHKRRFESGKSAAERRGWNVLSTTRGIKEAVYSLAVERAPSFVLEDNTLASAT